MQTLNIEVTGDVEMVNTIRTEVQRLCNKNNVVSAILCQDEEQDYDRDYQRMIAIGESAPSGRRSTHTSLTSRSQKSGASLGWDPILAGYRARSVLSEPGTPVTLQMERSRLPMDLDSTTTEGSLGSREDSDAEYPDSEASDIVPSERPALVANDNAYLDNGVTIGNQDNVIDT